MLNFNSFNNSSSTSSNGKPLHAKDLQLMCQGLQALYMHGLYPAWTEHRKIPLQLPHGERQFVNALESCTNTKGIAKKPSRLQGESV